MKIDITYSPEVRRRLQRRDVLEVAKWPFLFAAYICPIVNACTGGRAWSVIVLWSLWIVWSLGFSTAMVEYNRISQVIKLITDACILLIMIDLFLSPGWAVEVVPIVCFGGLALSGVLFFTDLNRQKQNMMPMLLLCVASLVSAVIGLIVWRSASLWTLAVMGAFALALLLACFMTFGGDFLRDLKKHFHTR